MILFNVSLVLVGALAGGIASICGFGIGSLLTPLLAIKTGTGIAVAGVSIVHFLGTAFRFWKWKEYINRQVLFTFGIMSAIGGLMGALFHNIFQNVILTDIFGALLVFAGFSGMTGISEKWRLKGLMAWVAGALSGLFGGLVGNQGGSVPRPCLALTLKARSLWPQQRGSHWLLIVPVCRCIVPHSSGKYFIFGLCFSWEQSVF